MLVCCSTATGALDFQVGCPDASALISDRGSADKAVTLIPPAGPGISGLPTPGPKPPT